MKLVKNNTLETFKSLAGVPAIAAFINHKTKKIYLFNSRNIGLYLMKLLSDVKDGKHSLSKGQLKGLKFELLETNVSDIWSLTYWYRYYTKLEYTFLNKPKVMSLIPVIRVAYDGVFVELRNKGYKGFVVGVFDSMVDAKDWLHNEFIQAKGPIYANNEKTRKHLCKN